MSNIDEKIDLSTVDSDDIKAIAHAWSELSAIRARDGSPDGISEEWWNELTERIGSVVSRVTGNSPHCNPILYQEFSGSLHQTGKCPNHHFLQMGLCPHCGERLLVAGNKE